MDRLRSAEVQRTWVVIGWFAFFAVFALCSYFIPPPEYGAWHKTHDLGAALTDSAVFTPLAIAFVWWITRGK